MQALDPSRPVHGGLNVAELRALGLRRGEVLDFSASINPLGVSPAVTEALRNLDLATYPDPDCSELRRALADRLGLESERILVGNGATELIHLLARALLEAGDAAAIFTPTFGEFEAACRLQRVAPVHIAPAEQHTFGWDLPAAARLIATLRPALLFVCNPNNPTGTYLGPDSLEVIAAALGDTGLLVLDEAYAPFVERRWDATRLLRRGNVVLLRSMTKDHALTGLRLGYLLGPRAVVRQVRRWQHSWSVNAVAQAAGIAALGDCGHVARGRRAVRDGRRYLAQEFRRLGLPCSEAAANFLLVRVGAAAALRLRLLREHRVCVRDCASFGLPDHVRIGVRRMADCRRLAVALREVLENGDG